MKKNQNNYAFVDSQNLNLGIRLLGWRLDYARYTAKEKMQFMNDLKEILEYKKKSTA